MSTLTHRNMPRGPSFGGRFQEGSAGFQRILLFGMPPELLSMSCMLHPLKGNLYPSRGSPKQVSYLGPTWATSPSPPSPPAPITSRFQLFPQTNSRSQEPGCTFDYFSRAGLAMGEWLTFAAETLGHEETSDTKRIKSLGGLSRGFWSWVGSSFLSWSLGSVYSGFG